MIIERRALTRFFKYSLIGASTFSLDLMILYILTEVFSLNYLISAGCSFLFAVSCNYLLSRKFIFKGSKRDHKTGYVYFILIALSGLLLITGSMYVLVEFLGANYLIARIFIAGIIGIWNYTLNLFFNFKVAGVYEK